MGTISTSLESHKKWIYQILEHWFGFPKLYELGETPRIEGTWWGERRLTSGIRGWTHPLEAVNNRPIGTTKYYEIYSLLKNAFKYILDVLYYVIL